MVKISNRNSYAIERRIESRSFENSIIEMYVYVSITFRFSITEISQWEGIVPQGYIQFEIVWPNRFSFDLHSYRIQHSRAGLETIDLYTKYTYRWGI